MANCSDNYWNALILPRILQAGAKHNKETTAKLETPGQNSFFKSMKERTSWNFWSCSQEKSNVACWKMPYLVRSFFPSRNICEAAGIFRPSPLTTLEGKSSFSHHCWLVVWNMNFIVPYIGKNHPNWLSYFSEGQVYHQPNIIDIYLPTEWIKTVRLVPLFGSGNPCSNFGFLHPLHSLRQNKEKFRQFRAGA